MTAGFGVIVCGDPDWSDEVIVATVLHGLRDAWGPFTLIHGDSPGPARVAAAMALRLSGVTVESHPAEYRRHGECDCPVDAWTCKGARARRNRKMLRRLFTGFPETQPDGVPGRLVVAFHTGPGRETAHMLRIADEAGVRCCEITSRLSTVEMSARTVPGALPVA